MKKIVILGSTGTIGQNTLEIVRKEPKNFQVVGLACHSRIEEIGKQTREFQPKYVCLASPVKNPNELFPGMKVLTGTEGLVSLATLPEADLIVVAIPGITTLLPVLAGLTQGKVVALATKEIMVVAGSLVMETARKYHATILPVDSEHNALFQCLKGEEKNRIARVYLTASGGPFLNRNDLENVNLQQVLNHPVWKMGRKVTVDSATLMNKAFEMIEAHHLFSLPAEKISVLIHPEAIVHGMVEFADGVLKAVLSSPDMRFALSYVLHYPERSGFAWKALKLAEIGQLTFQKVEEKDGWFFLARKALSEGGSVPVVLNGANEEAVSLFLQGAIRFTQIIPLVEQVLKEHPFSRPGSPEEIIKLNQWARSRVRELVRLDNKGV
ncbi:MAG: 1-deoxy-D-xylulose-5-phosphate reductoisomerase [Candidatus Omnitrophica bacterium]|nr:1-deoxy-D-xylulose-5-phosphate reductoisomerase [Candidatus Omnitrophota bacterium]